MYFTVFQDGVFTKLQESHLIHDGLLFDVMSNQVKNENGLRDSYSSTSCHLTYVFYNTKLKISLLEAYKFHCWSKENMQ